MKLAFVGGTRFIGHAAATVAHARGHHVAVLHRGATPNELPFAEEFRVDRDNPSALSLALAKAKPDVVVDTRAMTKSQAETTALAVKMLRVPAVVLSSQDVYAQFGRLNGLPAPPPVPEALVREHSPLTVPYPFAAIGDHEGGPNYDKKDVEAVFRDAAIEAGISAIALRLPGVYGDRDPKRRFGAFADALDDGMEEFPAFPGPSLRLTHVHVRDAAHAIVLAAEARGLDGFVALNVGEADTPTLRERIAALAHAMNRSVRFRDTREPLPPSYGLLGEFPNDCVMDTSRLREMLGFREITTEDERLADLLAWLRRSRTLNAGDRKD
jgi:nucleoside-diphosphate-sugar epimerase